MLPRIIQAQIIYTREMRKFLSCMSRERPAQAAVIWRYDTNSAYMNEL